MSVCERTALRCSRLLFVAGLAWASSACAPVVLPAKPPPPKTMPVLDIQPLPPAENEGQVVIDAHEHPAAVSVVLGRATAWGGGHFVMGVQTKEVCSSTPCVVNLPGGEHELVFTSLDDPNRHSSGKVKVGEGTTVFRHDLGGYHPSGAAGDWGMVLASLGILGAMTGGSIWFAGAVAESDKTASAGKTTTLLSAAGIGVGIGLSLSDRPTVQDGSSVQWSLHPGLTPGVQRAVGAEHVTDL